VNHIGRLQEEGAQCQWMSRRPVANQGGSKRLILIINPHLTLGAGVVEHYEGCLSLDGFQAMVPRAQAVTVEALDHHGAPVKIEANGWYARILQHEIDHLDGTLYIDRMHTRTFTSTRNLTQPLT
jgi:peptide deformylase